MSDTGWFDPGRLARFWRRTERIRTVNIGRRDVLIQGIAPSLWTDVYYGAMMASWPGFLAGLAGTFVLVNALFAFLYWLVPGCIANARGEWLELFFFSVETLTTVGYGEYYPQTDYAHVIVSIETFAGLFFTASMLGLIFARVSRPRARLIFARSPTVAPHEGAPTLVIRVANERLNMISSATARLWLSIQQATKENVQFRRFLELKLVRSENPIFALSWTLLHVIDEASPLFGLGEAELAASDAFMIVSVIGYDETAAQEVQSRHTYKVSDIRWNHRYVDILETTESGNPLLNYARLHDVEPVIAEVITDIEATDAP